MEIRTLGAADAGSLAAAFDAIGWAGKSTELFCQYFDQQLAGARVVLVAEASGRPAGYVCVVWRSGYPPFREAGIPEIVDLNVLPAYRRRGIGTRLLDAAEGLIARRSPVAGIGCGLFADYGPALRLYLDRGYRPDGRGVAYDGRTVPAGETIRVDDSAVLMLTRSVGWQGGAHSAGEGRSGPPTRPAPA